MKIKVISRNPDEYMGERKKVIRIHRLKRNYDPALHPLVGQRKCIQFNKINFLTVRL